MDKDDLVERALSEKEMAALVAHTKWVACSMCEGSPPVDEPGTFCVLCCNTGQVTNGTRDVTAHLVLSYRNLHYKCDEQAATIQSLQAENAALREGLAWIADHSTERPCMTSTEHNERTLNEVQQHARTLLEKTNEAE